MMDALALLRRFRKDEVGAFATLFGIMAIVLVATSGAVVDYTTIDQARNKAQVALDAATLALQSSIYSLTDTELSDKAEAIVSERLDGRFNPQIVGVETNTSDGKLFFRAELTVPMNFVALVGISEMTTQISSQATRKKNYLEVAFVLDNSGSMSNYSRMTNLKSAATCATNILFYGECTPPVGATKADNVLIGLVPFNMFVNIGASHSSDAWMDQNGISPISNDNFDDDNNDATPYTGPVDRFSLYSSLVNEPWKGCVEARPYPYSVDDTEPTTSNPSTLFVPVFAPDEPSSGWGWYNNYISDTPAACPSAATWVHTQVKSGCNLNGSWYRPYNYNNATCTGGTTNDYELTDGYGTVTNPTSPPASMDNNNVTSMNTNYSSKYSGGKYTNTRVITYTYDYSNREKQERLCKYAGADPSGGKGPNAWCPNSAILALTDQPTTATSAISGMAADGGTNIHQGVIWGFHLLSPTAPFAEGGSYDSGRSKVMIVMTDGENTYYDSWNMNKTSYYQAYAYLWNNDQDNSRTGVNWVSNASNMQTRIDQLTVESCNNAKAAGIEVYTIGLSSPNSATVQMLKDCATDDAHAYFPSAASELNTVFAEIAEQLAALRLAL